MKRRFIPHIHEGIWASIEINITASLTGSKNTENLKSTSLENKITAALTENENTDNLTSSSLENDITGALTVS